MRPISDTIAKIRSIIEDNASASEAEMSLVAGEYAEACAKAQRRLQDCMQLMGQGLHTEAIYIAESSPPLLDMLGLLDYEGSQQWREFAAAQGYPVPKAFNGEQIQALDQQYSQSATLEPLIANYRKLCVKQSPASERIAALRRIRAADPDNANWPRDLESLEMTRFKEIAMLFAKQRDRLTEVAAEEVVAELKDSRLLSSPPPALVAQAESLYLELRQRRFDKTSRELAAKANDAYVAMEAGVATAALKQLDALAAREELEILAEVTKSLGDTRQWCEEKAEQAMKAAQFSRDGMKMEKLLENEASSAELARQLKVLEDYGMDLPGELGERSRAAVRGQLAEEQRRRRLRIACIAAGILVFVAGVAIAAWFSWDHSERTRIAGEINRTVEQMDVEGGTRLISQLKSSSPGRVSQKEIAKAIVAFEKMQGNEQTREKELKESLARVATMELDDPMLQRLMDKARKLATTVPDQRLLVLAETELLGRRQLLRKEADDRLMPQIERIAEGYDKLRKADGAVNIRAAAAQVETLLAMGEAEAGASTQLLNKVKDFRQRYQIELKHADELEQQAKKRKEQYAAIQQDLKAARGKLPDVEAYLAAVKTVEQKYPGNPAAGASAQWEPLIAAYSSVVSVNQAVRKAQAVRPPTLLAGSPQYMAELQKHLSQVKGDASCPYNAALVYAKSRLDFLADFDKRVADLQEKLAHPLISQVNEATVRNAEGVKVRFYLPRSEKSLGSGGSLSFTAYDAQHRTQQKLMSAAVVSEPKLAAHCELAAEISKRLLEAREKSDWCSSLPEILALTCSFKNANPGAQALLLQSLVELDQACGEPCQLTPRLKKQLAAVNPEPVIFLAPSDDKKITDSLDAIGQRMAAVEPLIKTHCTGKTLQTQREFMQAQLAALLRPLALSAVVGVNESGELTVQSLGAGHSEYWALVKQDGQVVFKVVATAAKGQAPTWLDARSPMPAGQVLLSPEDSLSTAGMQKTYASAWQASGGPAAWPVNFSEVGK